MLTLAKEPRQTFKLSPDAQQRLIEATERALARMGLLPGPQRLAAIIPQVLILRGVRR